MGDFYSNLQPEKLDSCHILMASMCFLVTNLREIGGGGDKDNIRKHVFVLSKSERYTTIIYIL